jgi:hypothetical protein
MMRLVRRGAPLVGGDTGRYESYRTLRHIQGDSSFTIAPTDGDKITLEDDFGAGDFVGTTIE